MKRFKGKYWILLLIFFIGCGANASSLEIKSDAFKEGGYIPARYTCESENFSPPLSWSKAPEGTKSFAFICDDPDAPMGTWVHWVVFNIPPEVTYLEENALARGKILRGIREGINDFKRIGYGGPCPPPGKPHRYFFKLYALDTVLPLSRGASKKDLVAAMQGHVIAQTRIVGLHRR